jgi:hypothetical protein
MYNTHPVQPGVGWEDDLKVYIHQSTKNRWYPQIRSGWFYLNGQEDYLYAQEGYEDIQIPFGETDNFVLASSPDFRAASRQGPIIIDGEEFRYTRATSNLSVLNQVTPTSYDNNFLYIDVPGELVALTNASGVDMVTVPSTGHLIDRNYYYWDFINRRAWIARDINDPNRQEALFATYLKDKPSLLQEEILLVDSDGKLRTMLDRVATGAWSPVIYAIGYGPINVASVDRNVITPSTLLPEGTRTAVRYYVDGSFCITEDDTNVENTVLSILRLKNEKAVIRWEEAQYNSCFDTGVFSTSDSSYVQINPIMAGVDSGFVYLSNPRHPAENLSKIKLDVAPDVVEGEYREPVRIAVTALDSSNTPLPKVKVDVWITKDTDQSIIYRPIATDGDTPMGGTTDFTGKRYFIWESRPELLQGFTVHASAMSASRTIYRDNYQFWVTKSLIHSDVIRSAKAHLYLNPNKGPDGLQDLYVYLTNQYGAPYLYDPKVAIHCELGRLYPTTAYSSSGSTPGAQDIEVSFSQSNISGLRVATCKYFPVEGDRITAWPVSNIDSTNPSLWVYVRYTFESVPLEVQNVSS